jgi:hypothetical protein
MSEKYRVNAFFNGVNTFKCAFPDLLDAQIEWRELRGPEDERQGEVRRTGFRRGNFTQGVIPCSNPSCHEGGYQIDRLVADMLRLDETEREGMMLCSGRETGEEVRRGPVRCPHRILFKAALSVRSAKSQADEDRRSDDRQQSNRQGNNRQANNRRGRGRGRGPRPSNVA